MEKPTRQDDVDGLEEEIDSTIDRLFVEKKEELAEELSMEPLVEPFAAKAENPVNGNVDYSAAEIVPFPKSIEKMHAQLLSLEWDVTGENLVRTKEEIIALKNIVKEEPRIGSVLTLMEKLLDQMMKNTENILPSQVNLLLDSRETIKLLTESETEATPNIYKRLAHEGIEARFSCAKESKDTETRPPCVTPVYTEKTETPVLEWKRIEEMLNHSNALCEKMGTALERIEQRLSDLVQGDRRPSEQLMSTPPMLFNITVFQINEKLFGVPSDKVVKLFKVPEDWYGHFQNHQRIRLKEFEVKIVDLKKILAFEEDGGKREIRILIVKTNEEYKGLMVERVLKRFPAYPEIKDGYGEYFWGMIHWNYQDHPVEVPILDLTRF
jgi:hypothetical protein